MLTWHFWPPQKRAIAHPSFYLPQIHMCIPPGYKFANPVLLQSRIPQILLPTDSAV